MNNFSERVFQVVREIPRGKVTNYGFVAFAAGKPRASRGVGFVLHRNTDPVNTPCHRVVFKDGSLCKGYVFGGPDVQREKLEAEGVQFLPDCCWAEDWPFDLELLLHCERLYFLDVVFTHYRVGRQGSLLTDAKNLPKRFKGLAAAQRQWGTPAASIRALATALSMQTALPSTPQPT